MPFNRPTLRDLIERNRSAIESELQGIDPRFRWSASGAIATANSGAHHEMFGFLAWIARQAFPDTVEDAELERQAAPWGVRRIAAQFATGTLAATGATGTAIPAGTRWRRADGIEIEALQEVRIAAGTATVSARAVLAGANGNTIVDTQFNLVSPIAGVVARARASSAFAGGADIETDDSLRNRWIQRRTMPPRGGTNSDYVVWSQSGHPDVSRSWSRPLARGLGTVDVYIMTDDATANGIPSNAVVATVQAYIDGLRPVTADARVIAPAPVEFDVTLSSVRPDTDAVRAAIEAEIADLILRDSEPGGTILVSRLREAVSIAQGEMDHVLLSPTADVSVNANQISVHGTVTFRT